jgi:hypothetical protein
VQAHLHVYVRDNVLLTPTTPLNPSHSRSAVVVKASNNGNIAAAVIAASTMIAGVSLRLELGQGVQTALEHGLSRRGEAAIWKTTFRLVWGRFQWPTHHQQKALIVV